VRPAVTSPATVPYGEWPSPVNAADVAGARFRLASPMIAGDQVWWQEARPHEAGRTAVVCQPANEDSPWSLPAPWDARTRVHEYGGRSYLPVPMSGTAWGIVFAHYADQRLYLMAVRTTDGTSPLALTPEPAEPATLRYADFVLSPDHREVWCVRERHGSDGAVDRAIVAVPLDGSAAAEPAAVRELAAGTDFLAAPTPSPDGLRLAWICWNHPNMPWDGTELRVGPAGGERPSTGRVVMGGPAESVLAPCWRDDSTLYVLSDRSGWWNPYRVGISAGSRPDALYPAEEEFAGPLWSLGDRPLAMLADGRLAVTHGLGEARLGILDPTLGTLTDLDMPYTEFEPALAAEGTALTGVAGGPARPASVLRIDAVTGQVEPMRTELTDPPPAELLPRSSRLDFLGVGGDIVHALVYPPSNPAVTAPAGELPPYVVWAHGGPTGRETDTLDPIKAYFTSRGIGIVAVNYGGSSGYGREYRDRLRHQWGVVDVADLVAAGRALVDRGLADPRKLAVRGPSAGGASALAAVTTGVARHGRVFAAAVSYFGVADLTALVDQTHDFESHYLDGLIGPFPLAAAAYRERSALGHVGPDTCPVLLLQGSLDPVVPPAQSAVLAEELAAHHIPHVRIDFPDESHGFRKAETMAVCLETELSFYGQLFGFTPPGISLSAGSPVRP
jgi:dipeptidyl aminopeptidase/acylaminoacyl peptidase